MKACIYCGKPAIGLDLCHAAHPICEDHSLGHQLAELPKTPTRSGRAKE